MKKKLKISILIVIYISIISALVYTYWSWSSETQDLVQQEKISEIVAQEYLINVTEKEAEQQTPIELGPSDFNYEDGYLAWGHSTKEAWGRIDCILEIPKLSLRQCVFSGTDEQIEHDLAHWLMVSSRSDYKLGETHYCIYTHRPIDNSTKISDAQEKLKTGDYLVLTQNEDVYLYMVNDVYPEWRNICTESYVENDEIDSSQLYIFTCGHNEWRYRNVVIDASVYAKYDFYDWQYNKDQYINDYLIATEQKEPPVIPEPLIMKVESIDNSVEVSVMAPDNSDVIGEIGLFDEDGYLVDITYDYKGSPIMMSLPQDGTYTIGLYKNDTEFRTPAPIQVELKTNNKIIEVKTLEDVVIEEYNEKANTKNILIIGVVLTTCMFIICILKQIRK